MTCTPLLAFAIASVQAPSDPLILSEVQALQSSDHHESFRFGDSLAMTPDLLLVGDTRAYGHVPGSGAVYVFARQAAGWVEEAKLSASDGTFSDFFGSSLAASGETVLVGAPLHKVNGVPTGAAYVFVRQAGTWQQESRLVASDPGSGDDFGGAVGIEGDLALVAATSHDHLGPNAGAAYVFRRVGSSWSWEAELLASDAQPNDSFGTSVALDGGQAAIGAIGEDEGGDGAGAVYLYQYVGSSWAEEVKLLASDSTWSADFGRAVALRGDMLLVGADYADGGEPSSGAAYVITRSGGAWTQQSKFYPADSRSIDRFGYRVSLGDGVALVGSPTSNHPYDEEGSAHLFDWCGDQWRETVRLTYAHPVVYDQLGTSVALVGSVAAAGAPQATGGGKVFTYSVGANSAPSFCLGDGSTQPCPCFNESVPGARQGCVNSTGAGAVLIAAGSASVSFDPIEFFAYHLPPNQKVLLFAGTNAIAGGDGLPFGDGLRCAGGHVTRIGIRDASPDGTATWVPSLPGNWLAGDLRRFQAWYRDPLGSPCGAFFNTTPGLELLFSD